jgi:GNAT superfamily N-acetyltransferase
MLLASCSHLRPGQLAAAAELALEFLGQSGADVLHADFAAFPELAIALTVDGAVAGVAFGHPDREDGATLEGITVDDAHTARGLGSLLLARFEQAAADAGYHDVNLGSAGGYVEHFYLKNGYQQAEYMVITPGGNRQRLDLDGLDVLRERHQDPDDLVLNIAAPEGYSPAVKSALKQRLQASEVVLHFPEAGHSQATPRLKSGYSWSGARRQAAARVAPVSGSVCLRNSCCRAWYRWSAPGTPAKCGSWWPAAHSYKGWERSPAA